MQITATKNYSQFKRVNSNRPVIESHVKKLMKAIQAKDLLHLNPIIVDKDKNIIDGQHRLEAAKRLNLMIHFIVDNKINDSDIASLNTNKSNWTTDNYIDYWISKGNSNFIRLRKFLKDNPAVSPSFIFRFGMQINPSERAGANELIRTGSFEFNNQDYIVEILKMASDFKHFDYRYNREFLVSLIHCIDSGEYDHKVMLQKIEMQPGKLKPQANQQKYIECIEEIYNYHNAVNHVNFRLTKRQREREQQRIEEKAKKQLAAKNKQKSPHSRTMSAEKVLANAKASQKSEGAKTIPVRIDDKTTVFVAPGTDVNKLKKRFNEREQEKNKNNMNRKTNSLMEE